MKKIFLAFGILAGIRMAAQEMTFERVEIAGVVNVVLAQGENCSVKIENDNDNAIKYSVVDGILKIEGSARKTGNNPPSATVTLKKLSSLSVEGVVNLSSNSEIPADELKINMDGVINADLNLKANKITVDQESVGSTTLKGSAQVLYIDVEGVGSFSSKELIASDVKVNAEGIGSVEVYAKDKLQVSNEGIGSVEYFGNPPVVEKISESLLDEAKGKMKRDTTKLKMGQQRILVFKDTTGRSYKKMRNKNTPRPWKGIGLSMDGYVNHKYSIHMVNGFEFMEQDFAKSIGWHWNFWEKDINLYKQRVKLVTGLGLEVNKYAFKNDIIYNPRTFYLDSLGFKHYTYPAYVNAVYDTVPHKYTKLKMTFIDLPLMLEYIYNGTHDRPASVSAGVVVGVRTGVNKKVKYETGGIGSSSYSSDYWQLRPYKCDFTVRMSKRRYTAYINYSLTKMYNNQQGPHLHPFSVGFNYRIFR